MTREQFLGAYEWTGIALLLVYVLLPLYAWWSMADPMPALIVFGTVLAIVQCAAVFGYFFGMSGKAFSTLLCACTAHALVVATLFGPLDRSFVATMALCAFLNTGVSWYWFISYIAELRRSNEQESLSQQAGLAHE